MESRGIPSEYWRDPIKWECEQFGYSLLKTIAVGRFGEIKLANAEDSALERWESLARDADARGHSMVAVKVVHTGNDDHANEIVEREVTTLRRLDHPHVIYMHEYFDSPMDRTYLVLEYTGANGRLGEFIRQYRAGRGLGLAEDVVRHFTKQLVNGMKYVHRRGIVHRDLTADNILLDDKYNLKITGFGYATKLGNGSAGLVDRFDKSFMEKTTLSTAYTPPEVLSNQKYQGKPADVWSVGVVFYLMVAGQTPFPIPQHKRPEARVAMYFEEIRECGGRLELKNSISKEAKTLACKLLSINEDGRPTLKQVSALRWLKNAALSPNRLEDLVRLHKEKHQGLEGVGEAENLPSEADQQLFMVRAYEPLKVEDNMTPTPLRSQSPQLSYGEYDEDFEPSTITPEQRNTPPSREKAAENVKAEERTPTPLYSPSPRLLCGEYNDDFGPLTITPEQRSTSSTPPSREKTAGDVTPENVTPETENFGNRDDKESTADVQPRCPVPTQSKLAASDAKRGRNRSQKGRRERGNGDTSVSRTTEKASRGQANRKKTPSKREPDDVDTSPMGKAHDDGDPLGNGAPGLKTRQRPEEKSGDGVSGRTRRGRKLVPMTKKDVGHLVEGAAFAPKPPPGKKYAAAGLAAPPPGQRPSSRAQIMKRERRSQEVDLDSSHRCTKPSKSRSLSQNVRLRAPESIGEQLGQLTSNTTSNSRFKARTPSPGLTPPPEEPEEDAVLAYFSDREKSLMRYTMEKKGARQQTAKLNRNHRFKARSPSPGLTPPPEEDTALTCSTPRRKGPQRPTGNTAQVRFKARTPSPCLSPPPEQPEEDVTVTLTFRGDSKSSRTRSTVEKKGAQQTIKRRHKKQEFGPSHSGLDDKLDSDKKVATEREVVFRPKTARGRKVLKDSTSDSKQRSSSDTKGPTQLLVMHLDEEPADKANRFKARTPSPCLSPPPECLTQKETGDNRFLTCLGDTTPSLKLSADGRKLVPMTQKDAGNLVEGAGFTLKPPPGKTYAVADPEEVATVREVVFRPKTARGRRVPKHSTPDSPHRSSSDTKGSTQLLVVHPDEKPAGKIRFKARTPSPCLSPPPEYLTQEESVDNGLLTCLGDTVCRRTETRPDGKERCRKPGRRCRFHTQPAAEKEVRGS